VIPFALPDRERDQLMRLRTTVAVIASALAVAFCLPVSARAAGGTFSYTFIARDSLLTSVLTDPPSGRCLVLPEVVGRRTHGPAFAPRNDTDATATGFAEPDCGGSRFTLPPHGGHSSARLTLRSVAFS
jgi:hypothetical protein